MPLIKAYNIDSDLHGLKSHSIFRSVYTAEASWKGTFGHLIQTASAENCFSLEDLRRRSIDPTVTIWTFLAMFERCDGVWISLKNAGPVGIEYSVCWPMLMSNLFQIWICARHNGCSTNQVPSSLGILV
jgi:hypothetical protein